MCTCTSCAYTDKFTEGFATWPRGEPAGKRASSAAYAAHQRACPPISKPREREVFGAPRYPSTTDLEGNGQVAGLASMPAWWYAWNNRKWEEGKAERPKAPSPRPALTGKPERHFPHVDRHAETIGF